MIEKGDILILRFNKLSCQLILISNRFSILSISTAIVYESLFMFCPLRKISLWLG